MTHLKIMNPGSPPPSLALCWITDGFCRSLVRDLLEETGTLIMRCLGCVWLFVLLVYVVLGYGKALLPRSNVCFS